MTYKGLRGFLEVLEANSQLVRIREELDPKYEIPAVLDYFGSKEGPAVFFERVKGYSVPVVGNLFGCRKSFPIVLGIKGHRFMDEYLERKSAGIFPVFVKDGPVNQVKLLDDIDILQSIPVLTYHEKDVGPYITQGVVFLKDPLADHCSMGIHRLQVRGRNQLGVFIVSPTSMKIIKEAEERGIAIDVAIAVGVDPVILLASLARVDFTDKLELAGGLKKEAIEIVKGETVNIGIPAYAEFVLEGKLHPVRKEVDGPFGESTGFYITSRSYTIDINVITHREDPIYTVFHPWSTDDELVTSTIWGAEIYRELRSHIPGIKDIRLTSNGAQAVVSMKKRSDADARQALYFILSSNEIVKNAVIVDDDIDIYNPREIDWALAYRFQPDKDLILLSAVRGSPIDPTAHISDYTSITSKMGLDATVPIESGDEFEKIKIPANVREKVSSVFKQLRSNL
jgi:2,5-furandicarboxylate decarboxylase 1